MAVPFRRPLSLALAALFCSSAALHARQTDSTARPHRLFRTQEPLVMWLQSDFKTVFKDRDSSSTKRYPAKLRFLDEKGDTVSLDVTLNTRGHYRLKNSTCAVPPLKVRFNKEQTKGTLFSGMGSLKLTTHCQKGPNYAQNVMIEYSIYGMYNQLTPVSLRARLASVTWNDPADPAATVTRPGFWTEEESDMAKRNKGKILMQKGGHAADMDERQMTITDIFQYMIGNTDWSIAALHNFRIVQTDTSISYFPMAYDFDWSGLVDAPYAHPDYRLPIKRVTDRLYRGACHPPEMLTAVLGLFAARKAEIYAQLTGLIGLDPARLRIATAYLDDFFKGIADPGFVKREFRSVCA